MLRHSDKREFLCNECGKTFKRKDKLKEHAKRIHENPLRKNNAQNHPNHPGNHNQEVVYPDDVLAISNAGPPGGQSSRLVLRIKKLFLRTIILSIIIMDQITNLLQE